MATLVPIRILVRFSKAEIRAIPVNLVAQFEVIVLPSRDRWLFDSNAFADDDNDIYLLPTGWPTGRPGRWRRWEIATGGGGGVTLPIEEADVNGLPADLAALGIADAAEATARAAADTAEAAARAAEDLTLFKKDGSRAATGAFDMNTHQITNLVDPSTAQGADTKAARDAAIAVETSARNAAISAAVDGLSWKQDVRAASIANLTLASVIAGLTVDGVLLVLGDRILLKDQTDPKQNGIYVVQTIASPVRATDADTTAELDAATVVVRAGTVNADTAWTQTALEPVIGVDSITWAQKDNSAIAAGDGLTKSGNTLHVGAGDGIQSDADSVTVKLDGTTLSKSATGLKVNAIPESAVTNLTTDLAAKEATANKAAASGYASLDAGSKVVQDPTNATATPTASKIPIADGVGTLDSWITPGGSSEAAANKALRAITFL